MRTSASIILYCRKTRDGRDIPKPPHLARPFAAGGPLDSGIAEQPRSKLRQWVLLEFCANWCAIRSLPPPRNLIPFPADSTPLRVLEPAEIVQRINSFAGCRLQRRNVFSLPRVGV